MFIFWIHTYLLKYICLPLRVLVGYSWIPLLKDGRMQSVELPLPVAATLPAGYLCQDGKKVLLKTFLSSTFTLCEPFQITRNINPTI